MVSAKEYLDRILHYYSGSFDVTAPCTIGGHEYAALAAMHAHEDQYVHLVGTTLWQADSHEFTLWDTCPGAATAEDVHRMADALANEMELCFVRRGEALPPADHQYTWLTGVLLSQKAPDEETIRAAQQVRQTKFYRFYLRGYSESHFLLVDLENRRLYTNRAGKHLKKLYQLAFDNIAKAEKQSG
jgi:hypothetical protein